MEGRIGLVLVALLAAGVGSAGCIEALESFSSSDEVNITAMEHRDLADGAAAAWHPQAFLIGVAALETMDPRAGVPLDDTIGDGRAPFWYYGYTAPDTSEVRLFRADSDGRVTAEEKLPGMLALMSFPTVRVGAWELDSPAVVAAALAHDEFKAILDAGNATLIEGLGTANETGTKWLVAAYSPKAIVVALVDPVTGEVEIQDFAMPEMPRMPAMPPMPTFAPLTPPVMIHDEDTLDSSQPEKSFEFKAAEGMTGYLEATVTTSAPMDSFRWFLILDDEVVDSGSFGSGFYGGEQTRVFDLEIEDTGDYTFVVRQSGLTNWMPFTEVPVSLGDIHYVFDLVVGFDVEYDDEASDDSQ